MLFFIWSNLKNDKNVEYSNSKLGSRGRQNSGKSVKFPHKNKLGQDEKIGSFG
jgi:hypothetical protein